MKRCTLLALMLFTLLFGNDSTLIVKAGTIGNWPPFMYEQNGSVGGMATELVKSLCQSAGVTLKIKVYPWARAYANALNKEGHMIFLLYRTPERENLFHWIGPIVPKYDMYLYKLKIRDDISVDSLTDIKEYRLGVVRDVAHHKYLKSKGFQDGEELLPVPDPEQNIKKLFAGRIDLLINNEYSLPYLLEELGYSYEDVEKVYSVIESSEGYLGVNKQTSPYIVEKLREAYSSLVATGVLQRIQEQYLPSE